MLTKCSNPFCSASFRILGDGKLFRFEIDPLSPKSRSAPPEYFWLCGSCATAMTLRIGEGNGVVAIPLVELKKNLPSGVAFVSGDRKNGHLLRCIAFLPLGNERSHKSRQHSRQDRIA